MIVEVITEDAIRVTVEDETTEVNVMVEESASPLIVEVGVQGPPGGGTAAWANITDKPATFPATAHTHDQTESHESADTDTSASAIHHTLGTGANQAATGNHGHVGYEPSGAVWQHEQNPHPSSDEKAALTGTSGTPGAANPYVTDADTRLDDARTPVSHKSTHATGGSDAMTPGDIGAATAGHNHDSAYAPIADGVTNGDSHNHSGGDGGQIAYSSISGLPTLGTAAPLDVPATGDATDAQVVLGSDTRLDDARTPTAHASTHATGQGDALTPSDIGASPATHDHSTGSGEQISYNDLSDLPTLGSAAALNVPATGNAGTGEVVKGDDTRLSDARTPTTHSHAATDVTDDATHRFVTDSDKSTWSGKQDALGFTPENSANKGAANGYAGLGADGLVPSAQLPTLVTDFLDLTDTPSSYSGHGSKVVRVNSGATALEFVEATAPGAHASTHATGQSDAISPASIGAAASTHTHTVAKGITVDGSGSVLTTGSKGFLTIPTGATIVGWQIVTDQSGSIVFDIKKCAHGDFPTTASICASAKPTVTSAQIAHDETLTGWTTTITAGDILEFVIDSASTVTRATLTVHIQI